MERKVFSNPEIAKLMNEKFVNIKIDREEYIVLSEKDVLCKVEV